MKRSHTQTKFVVIGGGTGSFAVLSGLKQYTHNISALVSMADDGGSTGALRDELRVLPPGDVRQCLVALSDRSLPWRELFNFRFENGSLDGHSFGNLFLSAVEKMTDDFNEAVRLAGELLHITGQVLPITLDNVRLVVRLGDTTIKGEKLVDIMDFAAKHEGVMPELSLEPAAYIAPAAAQAILDADMIVIAPGDLYTSLGPLLVVNGVSEALHQTKARIVYVSNLVANPRQTPGFTVSDHAAEIERFAGGPILDYVLYNTEVPAQEVIDQYMQVGEHMVQIDELPKNSRLHRSGRWRKHPGLSGEQKATHYKLAGRNLLASGAAAAAPGDALAQHRSFIRHDSLALARALVELSNT